MQMLLQYTYRKRGLLVAFPSRSKQVVTQSCSTVLNLAFGRSCVQISEVRSTICSTIAKDGALTKNLRPRSTRRSKICARIFALKTFRSALNLTLESASGSDRHSSVRQRALIFDPSETSVPLIGAQPRSF